MIVTFDHDFKDLANLLSLAPKVIFFKSPNHPTKLVANILQNSLEEITAFNKSEIYGVMEIS